MAETDSQFSPEAQLLPQPPQWFSLEAMFTAFPPQHTCEGSEPHRYPLARLTHFPLSQRWQAPHEVAQLPQCASLVSGLKH